MNQEKILNFLATLDHQLLAAAAVLLLLLLLLWRVWRRTSCNEREVARFNERLERIREEVRSISRPPLSVAPVKEALAPVAEVTQPPREVPASLMAQPEDDDVLSRAAASLAETSVDEGRATTDSGDSVSFEESSPSESNELPATAEAPPTGVVRLEGDPARPGVSMVRCLSCNYKLAYPEKLAGKRVRCPSCRTSLDLP
jgi:hypothetical protein